MSAFKPWTEYLGVPLARHPSGAYTYLIHDILLDADGSPYAYHPDNIGRDDLRFASWPNGNEDWRQILVSDPLDPDQPYVQEDGPAKGYFLSMTTLRSQTGAGTDPDTYVDSEAFPYLVFPADFLKIEGVGGFGDVAMTRHLGTSKISWAVVADQGPAANPLGEISLRLAEDLGGMRVNPRDGNGIAPGPVQFVLFPNSRLEPPWPQTAKRLERTARRLLREVGGWPERI